MVIIRIVVEGGYQGHNADLITASNTESLRQSLHSFFSRLLARDDVSVVVVMGAGYRAAAKHFLQDMSASALFVDSDAPKSKLNDWFLRLESADVKKSILFTQERRQNVFFMVQEMEAWFLKQPECLEKWAERSNYSRRNQSAITEHSLIANKSVEDIQKPSVVLATLLKHFFERRLDGEKRKLAAYGKLKTASLLLDCLDVALLEAQDSELQRFKNILRCALL